MVQQELQRKIFTCGNEEITHSTCMTTCFCFLSEYQKSDEIHVSKFWYKLYRLMFTATTSVTITSQSEQFDKLGSSRSRQQQQQK